MGHGERQVDIPLNERDCLPVDGTAGTLIGRAWIPGNPPGPSVIAVRGDGVWDISALSPTVAELLNGETPAARVVAFRGGQRIGSLGELLAHTRSPAATGPRLLAPIDLQAIKACGVTFANSLLERVIEEQTKGDPKAAESARRAISSEIGADLKNLRPGSPEAMRLKEALIARDLWSQYLEVGIGPDAEVFTKAQPLSAVGTGADIGIHPDSRWNNPEPEVVLIINARGEVVGAALGNDVNLRDFEGRSALLLGRAKDNNGSCAIGPFIRLFDATFGIDDVRRCEVSLKVEGTDGFQLKGRSSLTAISRDVLDLAGQAINRNHQYPDGLALFTGTMFAPVEDRGAPGMGFTHKVGDLVTIAAPKLGTLVNRVGLSTEIAPWDFGITALMRNLAARGLLQQNG